MFPILAPGIWAATQPTRPFAATWVPAIPDSTAHYFLVVTKQSDGTIRAFIRNPEYNAGAFIGTRTVLAHGNALRLHGSSDPDALGTLDADGTITIDKVAPDGADIRFHPATPADLLRFYPSPTADWHYTPPANLGDGWKTGTLASEGMQEAPIATYMSAITSNRTPALRSPFIQSVAIERHGTLVLDDYFYGFGPNDPKDVRSAGKSVTTLMVGRAIQDSGTFSPQSRVLPLLPQYLPVKNDDARKDRMTVADLMTMASGFACNDNDDSSPGNEGNMQSQPAGTDWYKYTLDLPMLSDPGTRAIYCTAGINLLGAIVQSQTHAPLDEYFRQRFALPMQFGNYAMWLMPPPANAAYMGGGDHFRPRDFLKFGALLLNGGKWNGAQIVSADWIRQSIVPRSAPEGEGDRYGYGWHITSVTVEGKSYDVVNAGGNGGQIMLVVPQLDLAMMITAGNYNQYPVWRNFIPQAATAAIESCVAAQP